MPYVRMISPRHIARRTLKTLRVMLARKVQFSTKSFIKHARQSSRPTSHFHKVLRCSISTCEEVLLRNLTSIFRTLKTSIHSHNAQINLVTHNGDFGRVHPFSRMRYFQNTCIEMIFQCAVKSPLCNKKTITMWECACRRQ